MSRHARVAHAHEDWHAAVDVGNYEFEGDRLVFQDGVFEPHGWEVLFEPPLEVRVSVTELHRPGRSFVDVLPDLQNVARSGAGRLENDVLL
jgi:hypothetical protein